MSSSNPETVRPAFTRENRYIVIKLTDTKQLTSQEREALRIIGQKCADARIFAGKRELQCLVIESDWPEYEPTWKAIEDRMAASPTRPTEPEDK